jgi:hypothetical protein
MLAVFPFEVVFKIQILNFLNSDVVFVDKMKMLLVIKFYNFSRSIKFILVI